MMRIATTVAALLSFVAGERNYPYEEDGPYSFTVGDSVAQRFPDTGCTTDWKCDITFTPVVPDGPGPFPAAVVSVGFTIPHEQYLSYAKRLASWGYLAFAWTPNEGGARYIEREPRGRMISAIVDWAARDSELGPVLDSNNIFSVGHSVGGQSATLSGVYDPRVKGVLGIDPVDCPPPFTEYGPLNPQASRLIPSAENAKFAYVGAELGGVPFLGQQCAPIECNFTSLYNAVPNDSWETVVLDAGHMQYLDDRKGGGPTANLCTSGESDDDTICREVTQTIMIAWAEKTVRGVDISLYTKTWADERVAAGQLLSQTK